VRQRTKNEEKVSTSSSTNSSKEIKCLRIQWKKDPAEKKEKIDPPRASQNRKEEVRMCPPRRKGYITGGSARVYIENTDQPISYKLLHYNPRRTVHEM